jgi:hypothetical protein
MEPRVASRLASFGASGAGALGFPTASLVRERLPVWLRVSPHPAPSGFASVRVFGSPRILAPSAPADGTPKLPRMPHPPALPSLRLRVAPSPASTAGSMMTSRFYSNFASSAEPRMNLRVQSGLANSSPTLDAFSISSGHRTCRQADMWSAEFNRILHRPVGEGLLFQTSSLLSTHPPFAFEHCFEGLLRFFR